MKSAKKPYLPALLKALERAYPDAECALIHESPFQLLIATILSAQCTDKRVNMVTPALFKKYPTPQDLAHARLSELETDIQSINFFRNKAKSLIGMAQRLIEAYNGVVPQSMQELITLPGVARKTANVILSTCFEKAEGVVVDTHVTRISQVFQLTTNTTPVKIEQDLMKVLPQSEWIAFADRVVLLGREYCTARKRLCEKCPIAQACPSSFEVL